jgi:hypothetical protein
MLNENEIILKTIEYFNLKFKNKLNSTRRDR